LIARSTRIFTLWRHGRRSLASGDCRLFVELYEQLQVGILRRRISDVC
jgi:hypothetical protein